jgi:hypothetical protein
MLRKTMIVLATAAALPAGLAADAFARGGGGGGHMGGGGGHIGSFGGVHMGGGFGGPHFAGRRGRFGVGAGDLGLYDSCDYTSLYHNPDPNSCYLDGSPLGPLNP